jgi:hypothetical protein
MNVIVNAILFQAGWFACVLGAANGVPWAGALVAMAIVGWHVLRAPRPTRELALAVGAAIAGALFETALLQAGLVRFDAGVVVNGVAPYWMVALWALFATTLNVSLRALREHPALAVLLGAAGGRAAYYAGERLGAIDLGALAPALVAIAIGWALLTPALLAAARRLDGYARA